MTLLPFFVLIGIAGIVSGSAALIRNIRQARGEKDKKFRMLIIVVFAFSVILTVSSFFVVYPYGENTRIVGFPFPSAAFERHNDRWLDFVGPTTLPFGVANAWFSFVLPHLVLWVFRRRKTG